MDYTSKRLLHTPEGVRDIYGKEYQTKLKIQELFHEKFSLFGYEDIQTPCFEFFDVFGKEAPWFFVRTLLHLLQDVPLSILWMKRFLYVFAMLETTSSISVIYRVN